MVNSTAEVAIYRRALLPRNATRLTPKLVRLKEQNPLGFLALVSWDITKALRNSFLSKVFRIQDENMFQGS